MLHPSFVLHASAIPFSHITAQNIFFIQASRMHITNIREAFSLVKASKRFM
ncbi:hypothetical protein HMPREF6745_0760 [Prevotella sp. oral taxon 472 str. F0295]|nr:hypothetical protein HMPREF6745_0760 [Prevotella sp. oral taxon 472 str. F0295]